MSARTLASAAKAQINRRATRVGSVVGVHTAAPHVALTFDDGPDPVGTSAVLTQLADNDCTATFFVLLTRVRRYPGLLAEVVAAGHEIGLHGVDHRRLTSLPIQEVRQRQLDGRAELEDAISRQVRWMRPPYGRQSLRTYRATRGAGMWPVFWGPTTWDWRDVSQEERVAASLDGMRAGSILLAHDGTAGPADGVDDGPMPALDRGDLIHRVLDGVAGRGLLGRSLGDVLVSGKLVLEARFKR